MDKKGVEIVSLQLREQPEIALHGYADALTQYIEQFMRGETRECFHLPHAVKVDDIAAALGIENLRGRRVTAKYQCNTVSGYTREVYTSEEIRESISVETMLNWVADMGMSDDNPNDFHAGFAVELDATTCAVFYLDQEEEVGICDACSAAGYDNAYHGCGHDVPDTYVQKYWFMMCHPDQVRSIEWDWGVVQ